MSRYAVVRDDGLIMSIHVGEADAEDFQGMELVPCGAGITAPTHYYEAAQDSFLEKQHPDISFRVVGLSVIFDDIQPSIRVVCPGGQQVTDGTPLEVEFDTPGVKRFYFMDSPYYLDAKLEVTVG